MATLKRSTRKLSAQGSKSSTAVDAADPNSSSVG
jgi:hypothetical protein